MNNKGGLFSQVTKPPDKPDVVKVDITPNRDYFSSGKATALVVRARLMT